MSGMAGPRTPRAGASEAGASEEVLRERELEELELEAAEDEDHGLEINRRSVLTLGLFLLLSIAALYFLLPQIAGLNDTWKRIEDGSPYWMIVAVLFGVGMFFGYVAMFRGIFLRAGSERIDWRASYQITMAGLAASRIFAAGGAGGLVLTAWALRRSGMRKRTVADKTISFLVLTYFPYAVAVILTGIGVSTVLVPTDLQRRVEGFARGHGSLGRWTQRLANLPASASAGMRDALAHVRSRDPALLGALIFWASQILVLWAAFRAFGDSPPPAVLVQAFFVGMLGNLLPMPGGVGGVEGGMIASFVAFGVDGGLAVVAVLVYRAFTFWLPLIPGVIAYFHLRKTVERWALSYTK